MTIRYAIDDFDSIAKAMADLRNPSSVKETGQQMHKMHMWVTPTVTNVTPTVTTPRGTSSAREQKEEKELQAFLKTWYNTAISDQAIGAGVTALQMGLSKQWSSKRIARAIFAAMHWTEVEG